MSLDSWDTERIHDKYLRLGSQAHLNGKALAHCPDEVSLLPEPQLLM